MTWVGCSRSLLSAGLHASDGTLRSIHGLTCAHLKCMAQTLASLVMMYETHRFASTMAVTFSKLLEFAATIGW
jgi:hypothetical protein